MSVLIATQSRSTGGRLQSTHSCSHLSLSCGRSIAACKCNWRHSAWGSGVDTANFVCKCSYWV